MKRVRRVMTKFEKRRGGEESSYAAHGACTPMFIYVFPRMMKRTG